jgi:DNA-binding IclR family transcriptional regulator
MADLGETTERLVAAVERAVAVLGALADAPDDLGTNEIARRTGINASSVSRLLATLAKDEYVRRVPGTGRYRLGLRLIQLGNSALARVDFREVVRPHLVALMEATGETATLSVPGGDTTMTVDFVQSPSSVRSVAEIGRPSIAHATAIGKVFLAHGGALKDGSLHAYTDRTITDRRRLAREVAAVRERGWAQAVGEREPDLNAVAVPVLDARDELMAVLGLQGPAWRFETAAMQAAVLRLQEHATTLSPGPG